MKVNDGSKSTAKRWNQIMIFLTGHRQTTQNRQDGFTVLELMVVIAVIGVLAVASYASMAMAKRPAVRQAVNYLVADLIAARNEAIKGEESCNINFNFAPGLRSYTYNLLTSGKTKTVSLGERFRDDVYFLPGTPGGADPAPTNILGFSPRGIATDPLGLGAGGGQVYLTDESGFNFGSGKVYRILIAGSGEVEAQVRDFTSAVWFEFN
jgi:prepilin-type N-terminal cleavage/methylation domain-containing protein